MMSFFVNQCFYLGFGSSSLTYCNKRSVSSLGSKVSKVKGVSQSKKDLRASKISKTHVPVDEHVYPTFQEPIRKEFDFSPLFKQRIIVLLRVIDLDEPRFFVKRLQLSIPKGKDIEYCNIYAKVKFQGDKYRMLGRQFSMSDVTEKFSSKSVHEAIRLEFLQRLDQFYKDYVITVRDINHIEMYIRPLVKKLVWKYRYYKGKELGSNVSRHIETRAVLPVSIHSSLFVQEFLPRFDRKTLRISSFKFLRHEKEYDWGFVINNGTIKDNIFQSVDQSYRFGLVVLNFQDYIVAYKIVDYNSVHKLRFTLEGVLLDNITDSVLPNGMIERKVNGHKLVLKGNRIMSFERKPMDFSPLPAESSDGLFENYNFGVIDLETFTSVDGTPQIHACGFKTTDTTRLFYISGVDEANLVVLKLVDELLRPKYNQTVFYCHNLGGYDVIFLLKVLIDFNETQVNSDDHYKLKLLERDNKIMSIEISRIHSVTDGKSITRKFTIRDSYCLFPNSLSDLCRSFDTDVTKSVFPHKFSNFEHLFYVGETPGIEYYQGSHVNVSDAEYRDMYSLTWSFRDETLKYLERDLVSLFEVLKKANHRIFLDYNIQMTKQLTISGLALSVFLTNYYHNNVPNVRNRSLYDVVKKAYYGGRTEVFMPYGENLFYWDVNSLYPYVSLNPLPGLKCKYVWNLGSLEISDLFGFFYCQIDTSNVDHLYIGLLPHRSTRSTTLMFPKGKWEGWYFSEEVKFASELGCRITVLRGYEFDRAENVFDDYVRSIYETKSNTTDVVQKSMAKSLLNNLLGRFGINLVKDKIAVKTNEEFEDILLRRDVSSHQSIGLNHCLISYSPVLNPELISNSGLDYYEVLSNEKETETLFTRGTSVVISAAITAYARVFMAKVMLRVLQLGGKIYYSDTDSLVTNIRLPEDLVSNTELGKFKMEHEVLRGYFLTNKTYCIVTPEGETIIRAKGVTGGLSELDFKLWLDNKHVGDMEAYKSTSHKNYTDGYVKISDQMISLQINSYDKRSKLFHEEKWYDTECVLINEMSKSTTFDVAEDKASSTSFTEESDTFSEIRSFLPDKVEINPEFLKLLNDNINSTNVDVADEKPILTEFPKGPRPVTLYNRKKYK